MKDINIEKGEIEIQKEYIEKIKTINEEIYLNKKPLALIKTYGCQMNAHDSEKIIGMLESMGYEETKEEKNADLVVYNTCCIRENAENRLYGNLGILKNAKATKKDIKVILCGCMMQQDSVIEKIKQSYRFVDIIFGTYNLYRLPQLLYTNIMSKSQIIDVWEEQKEIIEDLPSVRKYKFKASVNIMYGCNNFCSYCIVPYVRGRERSREAESIINEIKSLIRDGVIEITLLGQNVNSYGNGLEEEISFAELLKRVAKIEGLERIRFMTSHPKDLSDELISVMAENDNICKYIHLPIQSGSNKILEAMNRKYTKEDYILIVDKLRDKMPDITISTDFIVGFPTETEEDNSETIDLIKRIGYSSAFTFIYSKRNGTPAASMPQLDEDVVKERFDKVLSTIKPIAYELNKKHIGKTCKVLAEEISKNGDNIINGRAEDNSIVHFAGSNDLIGTVVEVRITDSQTFYLIGEIL